MAFLLGLCNLIVMGRGMKSRVTLQNVDVDAPKRVKKYISICWISFRNTERASTSSCQKKRPEVVFKCIFEYVNVGPRILYSMLSEMGSSVAGFRWF